MLMAMLLELRRWMTDLTYTLAAAAVTVEGAIRGAVKFDGGDIPLAMMHAVQGGKSLRGFLVLEGARLHGIDPKTAAPIAGAIEAIHGYSLVHDDLPCMDDDDLRRGQPTVHKKWNEATAVLAGDALQSLAFELIMLAEVSDRTKVLLAHTLALRAGADGMVGGQAMDMAAERADVPLDLAKIEVLQSKKTGALIEWAVAAGPILAEADEKPMHAYGRALGLAFQIADDVLDIEGDAAEVGKAVGKDAAAGKATFVSLLGLQGAKNRAAELVAEACDALSGYGGDAETLKDAARFVIARSK
jgi:farnesyl diphosphate synthase